MTIKWDEEKRLSNIAKHGVDFVDAHEMFAARMLVNAVDLRRVVISSEARNPYESPPRKDFSLRSK